MNKEIFNLQVKGSGFTLRRASVKYDVPLATLCRFLKALHEMHNTSTENYDGEVLFSKSYLCSKDVFSEFMAYRLITLNEGTGYYVVSDFGERILSRSLERQKELYAVGFFS